MTWTKTRRVGRSNRWRAAGALILMSSLSGTAAASPINVIFTIDPMQSTESYSGNDNTFGAIVSQSTTTNTLSTPVSGNFVVSFDPSSDTPQSIQIAGSNPNNNNGFYQLANSVPNASPFGTPANLAGNAGSSGQLPFALRNLVYNLNSPVLNAPSNSGLTETFTATTTFFKVTAGGIDYATPNIPGGRSSSYVGASDHLTTGNWSLSESAPGSGNWTLSENGAYTYHYNNGFSTGSLTASAAIVATAQVTTTGPNANVAPVPTPTGTPVTAQALGGSSTTGGVSATFNPGTTGGTLAVQQVPGITSLTQAAIDAGQHNPAFAVSTSSASIGAPQIWNVQFDGSLNGGQATLVFDYDPSLLPAGFDQSQLGIWHYNELVGQWQFGGTVDVPDHTITFVTSSFSPFELGSVPEPTTIVLALGALLPFAGYARRRKRTNSLAA
jgi:hypothetical protein